MVPICEAIMRPFPLWNVMSATEQFRGANHFEAAGCGASIWLATGVSGQFRDGCAPRAYGLDSPDGRALGLVVIAQTLAIILSQAATVPTSSSAMW